MAEYVLDISGWHPAGLTADGPSDNPNDPAVLAKAAAAAEIPRATGRRRVDAVITLRPGQRSNAAGFNGLASPLAGAGLLVDSITRHYELGDLTYLRGGGLGWQYGTRITLTDL